MSSQINKQASSFILFVLLISKSQEYDYKCSTNPDLNQTLCNSEFQEFNITLEFQRLSELPEDQRATGSLVIQNTSLSELPENAFFELPFERISITGTPNLTLIHTKAFGNQLNDYLQELIVDSPTELVNRPPDYNLFGALNSLKNLQNLVISLKDNYNHFIPDSAFSSAQNNLQSIVFKPSDNSGYKFSTIGSTVFTGLPKLTSVSFKEISVRKIRSNAFNFNDNSTERLKIDLQNSLYMEYILEDTLEVNSFIGANRPVTVNLAYNQLQYIRENKFKRFLDENNQNILQLEGNPLNCDDTDQFNWLLSDIDKYQQQVLDVKCYNGSVLWDLNAGSSTTAPEGYAQEFNSNFVLTAVLILFCILNNLNK